jgi:hypothetical protein
MCLTQLEHCSKHFVVHFQPEKSLLILYNAPGEPMPLCQLQTSSAVCTEVQILLCTNPRCSRGLCCSPDSLLCALPSGYVHDHSFMLFDTSNSSNKALIDTSAACLMWLFVQFKQVDVVQCKHSLNRFLKNALSQLYSLVERFGQEACRYA